MKRRLPASCLHVSAVCPSLPQRRWLPAFLPCITPPCRRELGRPKRPCSSWLTRGCSSASRSRGPGSVSMTERDTHEFCPTFDLFRLSVESRNATREGPEPLCLKAPSRCATRGIYIHEQTGYTIIACKSHATLLVIQMIYKVSYRLWMSLLYLISTC